MHALGFASAPTNPKQPCRLVPRQPPIARLTFLRKRHANDAAVKAFFRVMVNRRTQVFEIHARDLARPVPEAEELRVALERPPGAPALGGLDALEIRLRGRAPQATEVRGDELRLESVDPALREAEDGVRRESRAREAEAECADIPVHRQEVYEAIQRERRAQEGGGAGNPGKDKDKDKDQKPVSRGDQ